MTDIIEIACDGGSRGNPGPAAVGAVVRDIGVEPAVVLATVSECIGETTNNVAEYTALIRGLEVAAEFGATRVRVQADSELLIRQLQGRYRVKNEGLRPLFVEVQALLAGYAEVDLVHVRREFNKDADALVNAALDAAG